MSECRLSNGNGSFKHRNYRLNVTRLCSKDEFNVIPFTLKSIESFSGRVTARYIDML